jgi:predicted nucleic acid-binding protein
VIVVLDAWAVVELLRRRPSAALVASAIAEQQAVMSSVNLGEAYYSVVRSHGWRAARGGIDGIRGVVTVEDPDWELVRSAAEIKARGGLSYPDAFCVATAVRHRAPLYTGDPEIIGLDAGIEVIDLRSTV